MRFACAITSLMVVLVVLVVNVRVLMLDWFMDVLMFVPFSQVKVEAKRHQTSGDDELQRYRIAEQCNCDQRTHERRN